MTNPFPSPMTSITEVPVEFSEEQTVAILIAIARLSETDASRIWFLYQTSWNYLSLGMGVPKLSGYPKVS